MGFRPGSFKISQRFIRYNPEIIITGYYMKIKV